MYQHTETTTHVLATALLGPVDGPSEIAGEVPHFGMDIEGFEPAPRCGDCGFELLDDGECITCAGLEAEIHEEMKQVFPMREAPLYRPARPVLV